MRAGYILTEQIREMEAYNWIRSQEAGADLGETALYGWVEKYAAPFREWAQSVPSDCIGCGICVTGETGIECPNPFNVQRKDLLKRMILGT
jgi:ferredoxin